MITGTARRAERALSGLDPAYRLDDPADADTRAATLRAILATGRQRDPGSGRLPRRRLVLAGAAAAVTVAAATVAVGAARPQPAPAYAATPPLLHYRLAAGAPSAADLLHQIAAAARRSPTKGSGGYGYIRTRNWVLENPDLTDHGGDLRVEPSEQQKWYRTDDGSVRYVQSGPGTAAPVTSTGGPGQDVGYVCWTAGQAPPLICPVDRLADADVMLRVLTLRGSAEIVNQTGRVSAMGAARDLFHDLVLPPAVRGQLWDALAGAPGIGYTGQVTDRGGRTGEAFSLSFDAAIGPVRDTLIVDPASGQLLSYERTLLKLTNPGYFGSRPLRIAVPAVVDYSVFLASELRRTNG